MIKLIHYEGTSLWRGDVLRLPASYPYEDIVDFMVFDPLKEGKGMGLIVATGYKAGIIRNVLIAESVPEGTRSLSTRWLVENWEKWIYGECSVNDVYVIGNYDPPDALP
jgi:hypothetical protein